jgi:signal transduction histidine kinase
MSLRAKTLCAVGAVVVALMAVLLVVSNSIILGGFVRLETQDTTQHVRRALGTLRQELDGLDTISRDWSSWDDTYAFVQTGAADYVESNLVDSTFVSNRLSLILIVSTSGELVYGRVFDPEGQARMPSPDGLVAQIGALLPLNDVDSYHLGILDLAEGPMLLSVRPVLTSEDQGPVGGTFVMGRILDAQLVQHLTDILQMSFSLYRLDPPPTTDDSESLPESLYTQDVVVQPLDQSTVAGYAPVRDIFDQPTFVLQVDQPRDVYAQGLVTVRYFLIAGLVVALAFAGIVFVVLDRWVLRRLAHLSSNVGQIAARGDFARRVSGDGKDEMAALAGSVNELLRAIETTQDQLKHDGAQRLQAEEEKRRLQEQLLQAQKTEAIGRLTAGIAHDFNNVLAAMNGFAELLQMEMSPQDPLQRHVTRILEAGHHAADLVRQLMAFGRKQVMDMKVLDLNAVVSSMNSMLQRVIGEDIQLEMMLAADLWPVKVDLAQLQQVIVNLAVNARDAMPGGGRMAVATANVLLDRDSFEHGSEVRPGDYAMLSIRDTGCGMSPEIQARIFEPFFTTKELGQGTGLGLSTVYGIMKQSGGHIHVDSQVGSGTTFQIYLPRTREAAGLPTPTGPAARSASGAETILLAEDEPAVREATCRLLESQGYRVIEAGSGAEALQKAVVGADHIHLLVTDVAMAGMNGQTLSAHLTGRWPDMKVLFVSGYAEDVAALRGMLRPGVAFLQKPFSAADLARKVRLLLDTPQ